MAVEELPFRLQLRQGSFEVRDYPALVAAEVTVGGDQSQAVARGFRILAGYIFGGNTRGEHIAMTAPVTQIPSDARFATMTPVADFPRADRWTIRFNMPGRYSLGALPAPRDGRVRLRLLPRTRIAALRFSGLAHDAEVQAKARELGDWIRARGLQPTGSLSLAQYDPPWTLWFLRRNELMIPLAG